MIKLPNDKWVRSTKLPQWALCLDPQARHYGWKMYEGPEGWVSGSALTLYEIRNGLTKEDLRAFWPDLQALLEHRTTATCLDEADLSHL